MWWLTGQHERALGVLHRYAADDFASVPRDHLWTDALCLFAEVAELARRRDAAQALIAHLDPYRDRLAAEPTVPLGAVAHYLGLAATSLEDWDAAQSYFHEAADLHDRIGADRWYARTLRAHAHMHRSRGAQETAARQSGCGGTPPIAPAARGLAHVPWIGPSTRRRSQPDRTAPSRLPERP